MGACGWLRAGVGGSGFGASAGAGGGILAETSLASGTAARSIGCDSGGVNATGGSDLSDGAATSAARAGAGTAAGSSGEGAGTFGAGVVTGSAGAVGGDGRSWDPAATASSAAATETSGGAVSGGSGAPGNPAADLGSVWAAGAFCVARCKGCWGAEGVSWAIAGETVVDSVVGAAGASGTTPEVWLDRALRRRGLRCVGPGGVGVINSAFDLLDFRLLQETLTGGPQKSKTIFAIA